MKVFWISDFDLTGSGYLNLSTPICNGLSKLGYEVKAAGLGYKGQPHDHKFSIIPAENMKDVLGITQNLYNAWQYDICVCALDIPIQAGVLNKMHERPFKYIGIMPIEADPLCFSWASVLMAMDKQLIISNFGTEEAKKMYVPAEHLEIGVDAESWRTPTEEERRKARQALGLSDCFAVLTVADNQERKNLSHSMDAFASFVQDNPDINAKYVLVTRENNFVGWKLRDYAQVLGINDKLVIFERGLPFKELWTVCAACDVFLLLSKAEGLGMPILESMSMGLPCIGMNCTAVAELLADGRGYLVDHEYMHVDPFGNGHRYWANRYMAQLHLETIYKYPEDAMEKVKAAQEYAHKRTWDKPIHHLATTINSLFDE